MPTIKYMSEMPLAPTLAGCVGVVSTDPSTTNGAFKAPFDTVISASSTHASTPTSLAVENRINYLIGQIPSNIIYQSVNTAGSPVWYRVGEQLSPLANAYSSYFVKIFDATISKNPCLVRFDIFAKSNGYSKSVYKCMYGNYPNLRPSFRVYNTTSSAAFLYVNIPTGATFEIFATTINNGSLGFASLLANCGTGANPNDVTGYTLKYDTTVDEDIYYAPKTISWTGPFNTATNVISITALNEGSLTLSFGGISTLSNGVNTYVASTSPVIPVKWRPYENQYLNILWVKEKTASIVGSTIEISTDGNIRILKNFDTTFSTVSGQPFIIYPFSFIVPINTTYSPM